VHDHLLGALAAFGTFEVAPKKGYGSLRRQKQFAMVGPATKDSIEVGLNCKTLAPHPRLKMLPAACARPPPASARLLKWTASSWVGCKRPLTRRVDRNTAAGAHSSVRSCQSSGNSTTSSILRK
jgi:hypothetical protein